MVVNDNNVSLQKELGMNVMLGCGAIFCVLILSMIKELEVKGHNNLREY